jgi:hypothetical protein
MVEARREGDSQRGDIQWMEKRCLSTGIRNFTEQEPGEGKIHRTDEPG